QGRPRQAPRAAPRADLRAAAGVRDAARHRVGHPARWFPPGARAGRGHDAGGPGRDEDRLRATDPVIERPEDDDDPEEMPETPKTPAAGRAGEARRGGRGSATPPDDEDRLRAADPVIERPEDDDDPVAPPARAAAEPAPASEPAAVPEGVESSLP